MLRIIFKLIGVYYFMNNNFRIFQLQDFPQAWLEVAVGVFNDQIIACSNNQSCYKYDILTDTWTGFKQMKFSHDRMPGKFRFSLSCLVSSFM